MTIKWFYSCPIQRGGGMEAIRRALDRRLLPHCRHLPRREHHGPLDCLRWVRKVCLNFPTHLMIFSSPPHVECYKLLPLEPHPCRRDDGHLQHHLLLHLHERQVPEVSSVFKTPKIPVRLKKRHACPWRWVSSKFNH